jgi:hypothetical protein
MYLDLSDEDAQLLKTELSRRIDELDRELVRTDKHELQVELDHDIERLRRIHERLGRMLGASFGASSLR